MMARKAGSARVFGAVAPGLAAYGQVDQPAQSEKLYAGKKETRATRGRRWTPQGTSRSFLQAVAQPLHSMQRFASQINFILAMICSPYLCDQAACTWQSVVLVSCIMVTES